MKILRAEQIRAADHYTIETEPIKSIDLMERAANAFVLFFASRYPETSKIAVVCGTGNNGGDGLAIARILISRGFKVETIIVGDVGKSSEDFSINFERAKEIDMPIRHFEKDLLLTGFDTIVDGIFGSGLSRPTKGLQAMAIHKMNTSGAEIVAIDIPSGLACDTKMASEAIVNADVTISFEVPKLAFFMPETGNFVNEWNVVSIGLDREFISKSDSPYAVITAKCVQGKLKKRPKFYHKGNAGKALLVSGSLGKMGAAILASRACLKIGVGLLTVHIPKSGNIILQIAVPEAMVELDNDENSISEIKFEETYNIIGIGPGIGTEAPTCKALSKYVERSAKPLVIDADGLNILSEHPEIMNVLPEGSILTPHPGEFQRLAGMWKDDFERLEVQRNFSKKNKVIVILKNAHTSISATDGRVYFNTTGNPGMATAGAGEVLTGVIIGLLGQGYAPIDASILGVYLHGLSGDIAKQQLSEPSITASDIIDNLSGAIQRLIS